MPEEAGPQTGFGLVPPETGPAPHQVPAATQGSVHPSQSVMETPAEMQRAQSHACLKDLVHRFIKSLNRFFFFLNNYSLQKMSKREKEAVFYESVRCRICSDDNNNNL